MSHIGTLPRTSATPVDQDNYHRYHVYVGYVLYRLKLFRDFSIGFMSAGCI